MTSERGSVGPANSRNSDLWLWGGSPCVVAWRPCYNRKHVLPRHRFLSIATYGGVWIDILQQQNAVTTPLHRQSWRASSFQTIKMGSKVSTCYTVSGDRSLHYGNRCICIAWQGISSLRFCWLILVDYHFPRTVCRKGRGLSWIMASSCVSPNTRVVSSSLWSWTHRCVHSDRVFSTDSRLVGIVWSFPIAFLLVALGSIIGESLLFLSFRHFLHDRIQKFRKEHEENYGTIVSVITQHKRWMVFLIRLSAIPVCNRRLSRWFHRDILQLLYLHLSMRLNIKNGCIWFLPHHGRYLLCSCESSL